MNKKERIRIIIGSIINLAIFAISVYCLTVFIRWLYDQPEDNRFIYFTNVSNLSVGFISLFSGTFLLLSACKGQMILPKFMAIIKYIGLSMTTLTFFTVLFVIAPMTSYPGMYSGVKFFTHLIIPVFAMISYLFFEDKYLFSCKWSLVGLIPFAIYSTIYAISVVGTKTWPDIYQINKNGLWYLFMIAFYVADFAILQGIYFLKKLLVKKDVTNK